MLTTLRTNCSRGKVSKDVVKTIGGEINRVPGNDADGALCP